MISCQFNCYAFAVWRLLCQFYRWQQQDFHTFFGDRTFWIISKSHETGESYVECANRAKRRRRFRITHDVR
jgi:hypothetical protein